MVGLSKLVKNIPSFSDKLRYGEGENTHKFECEGKFRPVLVFNITSVCNLFCKHCYYSAKVVPDQDELTTQEVFDVVEDIAKLGVPVVLVSGGEPLMRKNIFDIISFMREKGIEVGLSTNGTLIKEHNISRIKASGVNYVGISIDGLEETHDFFRGKKGAFRLSEEGISFSLSEGMTVSVRLTLTRFNKDELPQVLDWAESLGVQRFCVYHLVGTGRGKSILDSALTPEETRQVIDMLYEKAKYLKLEILTVDAPFDGFYVALKKLEEGDDDGAKLVLRMLVKQGGDGTGKKLAVLSHRGDVFLSQFWLNMPIGNVRERRFSDIWSDDGNTLLSYLRRKVRDELEGRCGSCPIKRWCGGFRPRAFSQTGKINGEDPLCYLTEKEKKMLSEYLNDVLTEDYN